MTWKNLQSSSQKYKYKLINRTVYITHKLINIFNN